MSSEVFFYFLSWCGN